MFENRAYTLSEEVFNTATHGLGVGLGIAALVILIITATHQHNSWKIISSALFGSTIILMYCASTLYHGIPLPRLKRFLKTMDHASIYLLIAGSYTPFCLVTLRGSWGWSLFGTIWGFALTGVIFKLFFIYRFQIVSLLAYLLMGWTAIVAIAPLYHHLAFGGLMWLLAGGLCYTVGTIFYALEKMKFAHGIWHLFVLAGTICHFFAIFLYVIHSY